MSKTPAFAQSIARFPAVATAIYVLVLVLSAAITWTSIDSVIERRAALASAGDLLARLQGTHPPPRPAGSAAMGAPPAGSPFLEGDTVTVAGAALLQRVASAVGRAGGNVLSSQVDVQGPQSASGHVSLTASCELDQTALQSLLYDLEAGMPFLFIDSLVAQAPLPTTAGAGGRMRVVLSVSAHWERAK